MALGLTLNGESEPGTSSMRFRMLPDKRTQRYRQNMQCTNPTGRRGCASAVLFKCKQNKRSRAEELSARNNRRQPLETGDAFASMAAFDGVIERGPNIPFVVRFLLNNTYLYLIFNIKNLMEFL
jgi:hypothetical protein